MTERNYHEWQSIMRDCRGRCDKALEVLFAHANMTGQNIAHLEHIKDHIGDLREAIKLVESIWAPIADPWDWESFRRYKDRLKDQAEARAALGKMIEEGRLP